MPKILLKVPKTREETPPSLRLAGGFWRKVNVKMSDLRLERGASVVGGKLVVKGDDVEVLDRFEKWYKWLMSEPN